MWILAYRTQPLVIVQIAISPAETAAVEGEMGERDSAISVGASDRADTPLKR
jgi:hypothetical protein